MSLNHSPSIVTNGLVLYTDMANTEKSWKGAPATNLLTYSEDFSNASWNGNLFGNWINAVVTTNNVVDPKGTLTADTLTGNYGKFTNSITATVSTAYTFSCWVKNISLVNPLYFHIAFGLNGTLVQYNNILSIPVSSIGDWTRYSLTVTSPASGINQIQAGIEFGGSKTSGGTFAVAAWGAQLEVGSFATPYIPTTTATANRSNTQALVDLTGTNTLTATSLTYASDNTFSFNGSSDVITIPGGGVLNISSAITASAWVYYVSGNGRFLQKDGPPYTRCWEMGGYAGTFRTELWHSDGTTLGAPTGNALAVNGWTHCVMTFDGINQVMYQNGVAITTTSFPGNIRTDVNTPVFIGGYWSGEYFNGKVGNVQIYNRALSASEVSQNFNALRGRYGI